MGYQTNYTLTCSDDEVLKKIFDDEDDDEVKEDFIEWLWFDKTKYEASASMKWYDHEDDMRKLSKQHKGCVFTLAGEGEDGEDLWKKYFLDGKMQEARARIEYDEFDSEKLK